MSYAKRTKITSTGGFETTADSVQAECTFKSSQNNEAKSSRSASSSSASPARRQESRKQDSTRSVGEIALNLKYRIRTPAENEAELIDRIMKLSEDPPSYRTQWWPELLKTLSGVPGGEDMLEEELEYVERCCDPRIREADGLSPLRSPGGYLGAKCRDFLKPHGRRLPRRPLD